MNVKEYLIRHYTQGTTERYLRDIQTYLVHVGEAKAVTATYSDIMNYIGELRKRHTPENIRVILQGIKKYYNWLNHEGIREDHPCKYLLLRDKRSDDIQVQDLFTTQELELLMDRRERYPLLKIKNQVVISLLIYQGLTVGEITNLTINDIDLNEGTVYIKRTSKTNNRTLKLKNRQFMLFHGYINQTRPEMLKTTTDNLIITKLGTAETGEGINYLVETFKYLFPERNLNPKTIRQSVIANLLKQGNDLRVVQVFAGHRYPSSTERYKQNNVEELKAALEKYHPLNKASE